MPRFTERGMALGELHSETRQSLAKLYDVSEGDLASVFADPTRIAESFRHYSPATLLAAHELLLLGTEANSDELTSRIAQRLDLSAEDWEVEHLLGGLHSVGVCVGTVGRIPSAFLVREAAECLHKVLWALPFPRRNERPPAPSSLSAERVRSLALLGRLAQHPVKLTRSNNVNRTTLRTFIKKAPISRDEAEKILESAFASGLCREYNARLVPLRDRILGRTASTHPLDRYVRDVVEREGAVPLIALRCAIDRLCAEGADTSDALGYSYVGADQRPAQIEAYLRRLSFVSVHEGWVFPQAAGASAQNTAPKDGFVTPAFDVMVARSASTETLLEVAMAAEIASLGQMSTFHLTPKSVQAAVQFGRTGEDILDALERVGAQPVPDNVRMMVAEWAGDSPVVRARRAWIVEGDDAALEAQLGASARLSPGRFEVGGDVAVLRERLQELQLDVPADSAELSARTESANGPIRIQHDQRLPLPSWRPPTFFGDDAPRELADRLRAAERGEAPWLVDPEPIEVGLAPLVEIESCFALVLEEAKRDLRTASKRWSRADQARLANDPGAAIELCDFLTLSSKWRRRAIKRASTPEELITESMILSSRQRLSGPGRAYFEARDSISEFLSQAGDAGDAGDLLGTESVVVPHNMDTLKGLINAPFLVELRVEGPEAEQSLRGTIRGIKTHRNEPAHLLFEAAGQEQGRAIPISKIRQLRMLSELA